MPFFLYEIRKSYDNGNNGAVYDAIFWAPTKDHAEEHVFKSVEETAAAVVDEYRQETHSDWEADWDQDGDREVSFYAMRRDYDDPGPDAVIEEFMSWMVGDPETHELPPKGAAYHVPWPIDDWEEPEEDSDG